MFSCNMSEGPSSQGYGEAEGQPVSMLVQSARRHRVPVAEYTPLGGETRQQFRDRVDDVFTTLCRWDQIPRHVVRQVLQLVYTDLLLLQ